LIIALTGYGEKKDIERAKAAGFDHHLVKPADPEHLFALIDASQPRYSARTAV
jgi:CheY-like chemotaxis protein